MEGSDLKIANSVREALLQGDTSVEPVRSTFACFTTSESSLSPPETREEEKWGWGASSFAVMRRCKAEIIMQDTPAGEQLRSRTGIQRWGEKLCVEGANVGFYYVHRRINTWLTDTGEMTRHEFEDTTFLWTGVVLIQGAWRLVSVNDMNIDGQLDENDHFFIYVVRNGEIAEHELYDLSDSESRNNRGILEAVAATYRAALAKLGFPFIKEGTE